LEGEYSEKEKDPPNDPENAPRDAAALEKGIDGTGGEKERHDMDERVIRRRVA